MYYFATNLIHQCSPDVTTGRDYTLKI